MKAVLRACSTWTARRARPRRWSSQAIATDGEAAPARKAPVGARAFNGLERAARATFFHWTRLPLALADTLTLAELAALRKEFAYFDVDGDGFVTVEDLTKVLAALEAEEARRVGHRARGRGRRRGLRRRARPPHLVPRVLRGVDAPGAYLREDRVDRLFHEYLDTNRHDAHLVTVQSLKAHGFDDASVADVFAAAKATPGKGISRRPSQAAAAARRDPRSVHARRVAQGAEPARAQPGPDRRFAGAGRPPQGGLRPRARRDRARAAAGRPS